MLQLELLFRQDSDDSDNNEIPNQKKSNIVARELYPDPDSQNRLQETEVRIIHKKPSSESDIGKASDSGMSNSDSYILHSLSLFYLLHYLTIIRTGNQ